MRYRPLSPPLPRRLVRPTSAILILVLLAIVVEEWCVGVVFMSVQNFYWSEETLPITKIRKTDAPKIGIAVVIGNEEDEANFELALSSLKCYAALHGYSFYLVHSEYAEPVENRHCQHADFMFHRHCLLRWFMSSAWTDEWIFFVDADMGVINPDHLLEEYLPKNESKHVVFYERIMNHEVMAGSYIVRNNEFSRQFLKHWADYFYSLPKSFHGTDNGAVHNVLLMFGLPHLWRKRLECEIVWDKVTGFHDLGRFVVCTQLQLKTHEIEGVEIRNKSHPLRWARDGWLTGNAWSSDDFLLHGWQKKRQDVYGFARWHSPLTTVTTWPLPNNTQELHEKCSNFWRYKNTFMITNEKRRNRLQSWIDSVYNEFIDIQEDLKRNGEIS